MCVRVPRVPGCAEMLVGAPATIGELDRVGFAEVDHTGRHQLAHQRGGARRATRVPGGGATHGDLAFDLYEVLDRNWDAVEWADSMGGPNGFICSFGRQAGVGGI